MTTTSGRYHFNPHSPCGERPYDAAVDFLAQLFQSTLPMRGATSVVALRSSSSQNFNPHSPCGERLRCPVCSCPAIPFQSTLPMRGATGDQKPPDLRRHISIHTPHAGSDRIVPHPPVQAMHISIHTPHAGSDNFPVSVASNVADFNPHSPCGERPGADPDQLDRTHFNPHSPCGERQQI